MNTGELIKKFRKKKNDTTSIGGKELIELIKEIEKVFTL